MTTKNFWKIFLENNPYTRATPKNKRMNYPKIFWKIYTSAKFKKIANVYKIRILRPSHKRASWRFLENLWHRRGVRKTFWKIIPNKKESYEALLLIFRFLISINPISTTLAAMVITILIFHISTTFTSFFRISF